MDTVNVCKEKDASNIDAALDETAGHPPSLFLSVPKKKERKEKNVEFSCGFIGAGTKAPSRLHQGAAVLENLSSGDVSFINAAADEAMSC